MKDRLFQIWFSLRCGIANREFVGLLDRYGSPYEIFSADEEEIAAMPCSDELKRKLLDKSLEECYRIQSFCETQGIGNISHFTDNLFLNLIVKVVLLFLIRFTTFFFLFL